MAKKNAWDELPDVVPVNKKNEWDNLPDVEAPKPPKERGVVEQFARDTVNQLPVIGGVVGGVLGTPADVVAGPAGTMVGAGVGGYLGTATKNLINHYIDPDQAPKTTSEALMQPIKSGVEQATLEGAGQMAAPYVAKAVGAVARPVAKYFSKLAEKKAVASTGATGVQASKFADDAGRQLLDRKIIGFGDTQEKIAGKAGAALNNSGKGISDSLKELDVNSAGVPPTEIISKLRERAKILGDDPATYGVSDGLNKLANEIELRSSTNASLTSAEKTKRGFQKSVNYNSPVTDTSVATEAADIYKQAVEEAAIKADHKVAEKFIEDKKTFGLLAPITTAAEKRAATVNQSPPFGLMDSAWGVAGHAVGGGTGMAALPVARRVIAPRINSSMAVSADAASKAIAKSPRIAKIFTTPITQLTGENLWSRTGLDKLGIKNGDIDPSVLDSKEGKRLLIEASDLPANSKKLQTIKNKLKGMGE